MKRALLHLGLFLGTCVTTWSCFHFFFGGTPFEAALFSGSALLILGAHEMGHYAMARAHGVDSSLPYFIPVPIGFGTFGAVIRIRSRIPHRNALVDIGAAGPLAGLFIAIPLLFVGLSLSHLGDAPPPSDAFPGEMSLWSVVAGALKWASSQQPPQVSDQLAFGDNLLIVALQRALWGVLPPGKELYAHPVLVAAWFGLLVTMLNLMPIGQLDGGHLTHAWFGRHAIWMGKLIAALMAFLALFYSVGWVVWLLLTSKVVGFRHPEVAEPELPLSAGRKAVCALCFLFFVLTLMPVPMGSR